MFLNFAFERLYSSLRVRVRVRVSFCFRHIGWLMLFQLMALKLFLTFHIFSAFIIIAASFYLLIPACSAHTSPDLKKIKTRPK